MRDHPAHQRLAHDAAYEGGAAFVIDHFCPLDQAAVPITDLGFNRADAVYDVVSVTRGNFFRLAQHQERLERSCERMFLRSPFDRKREAEILNELVARTGLKDAYAWWAVTRGATPHVSRRRLDPASFENRFFAYVVPYIFICDEETQQRGANVHIAANHIRIPPRAVDPRAKNFHGLDLSMSLFEAGLQGADWTVLTDQHGVLTEAPGSNIFLIADGFASTPAQGCLEGVTRQAAMDLLTEIGIPCQARDIRADELGAAEEAFLTSTAGGIMPISHINGGPLRADFGPGPISTRLQHLYWQKRWDCWDATPVTY